MRRKERMGWYIENICGLLCHLQVTQANEIECKALWLNLRDGHPDIAQKMNVVDSLLDTALKSVSRKEDR